MNEVWVVMYDRRGPDQLIGSSYYSTEAKADVAAQQFRTLQHICYPWAVEVRKLEKAHV